MKFVDFFITRPVFTIILNTLIAIIGILSFNNLKVREYPKVDIPILSVRAFYPNASAKTVELTVTHKLEEALSGIQNLDNISSITYANFVNITLHFKPGSSIDQAIANVRENLAHVKGKLPPEIKDFSVTKMGGKEEPFFFLSLASENLPEAELTHYTLLNIKNTLQSIKGVAAVKIWGKEYVMKVTIDPKMLMAYQVTFEEIIKVLEKNDLVLPAGKFQNQVDTSIDISMSSPEEFKKIVIKYNRDRPIFLENLTKIELSQDDKDAKTRVNGKPGLLIGVVKTSDGNPLEVSNLIRQEIKIIQKQLQKNVHLNVMEDQADFIRASLSNIRAAIIEAAILVIIIIFLFLQNVRSGLIPLITIPLSLIGTLFIMNIFGLSLNIVTLLAMVLSVGLVVDDAIVVVENIYRHIENGLSPLQAAKKGSKEIRFAIIAMTFTLASVYLPIVFYNEPVGQIFSEFAITLAGSVIISGIVALTLSPMMCSKILRKNEKHILPQFSNFFLKLENAYNYSINITLDKIKFTLIAFLIIFGTTCVLFYSLPKELAPKEDRGSIEIHIPSIPGKNFETLDNYIKKVETIINKDIPEISESILFIGNWGAHISLTLKDMNKRKRKAFEIVEKIRPKLQNLPSLNIQVWSQNTGLPNVNSNQGSNDQNDIVLRIATTASYKELSDAIELLAKKIKESQKFSSIWYDLALNNPSYNIKIDPIKLAKFGLTYEQISKIIQIFFNGLKYLEFKKDGVRYNIVLESENSPWTLDEIYLTNNKGQNISLGNIATLEPSVEPASLFHYNQMRAANIFIKPNKDISIEDNIKLIEEIKNEYLSKQFKAEWSGVAKDYKETSNTMTMLMILALVFIYAILAMQFESFIDPLIIMITVPLACFGGLLLLWMTNNSLNIFTQVGIITLIGLITKHGILIVDFANKLIIAGKESTEAIKEASLKRFRPILMTSSAMIFGSIPLIFSLGAGAEARRAIGYILVGGICFGTILTLFIIPSIYKITKELQFKYFK